LLVREQFLQFRFLLRAALEHKQHAVHRQVWGRRPAVKLRARQGVDVPRQSHAFRVVHGLHHAWLCLPLHARWIQYQKGTNAQKTTREQT
jgi:hypothetical protein